MSEVAERITYEGRPSWLNYYLLYIAGIVLFAIFSNIGEILGGLFVLILLVCLAWIQGIRDPHGVKEKIRGFQAMKRDEIIKTLRNC